MNTTHRLYVIVDQALAAGLKMAQAIHAAFAFDEEHAELRRTWYTESNNIVVLETPDIEALSVQLDGEGLKHSRFLEPDLGGALTAICVEPAGGARLSNLPLAR